MRSSIKAVRHEDSPERLLEVAHATVAEVKNCWLVTNGLDGTATPRVVAPIPGVPGERDWTIWILTSASSRKMEEIRHDARVSLGYQHDPDSAYVALFGRATIVDDRAQIAMRWKPSWNTVFASGAEDSDAIFLRVDVDRIELFSVVRKVTPPPFSKKSATLKRDDQGNWNAA